MPRPAIVRMTLAFIAVAALGGCGVTFRSHRVTPPELVQEEVPWIGGAITVEGAIVHFDQEPARNRAEVRADTLHGFVDGRPVALAMEEVAEVWILRSTTRPASTRMGRSELPRLPRISGRFLRQVGKAVGKVAGICFTVGVVYVTVNGIRRLGG
jgi:hypothetical protein